MICSQHLSFSFLKKNILTLYAGAFSLTLHFPDMYPTKPPTVKFISKMFHPNVFADGSLCLDILTAEKWSPVYSVQTILTSIQSLLNDPVSFFAW